MKKNFYKFLSLLLVFCTCIFGNNLTAFAKDGSKYQLSKSDVKNLTEKVNSLSDSEFDKFVLDYIRENQNFEYSVQTLEQVGVTLDLVDDKQSSISPMTLYPSDYTTFNIYSAHRGNEKFTRILVNLVQGYVATETHPGTLDVLSVEWDPTVATYYSYSEGDYVTYRDGSNKANGIVVFNVEDKNMSYNSAAYAGVYVTPKVSGAVVEIGSKFTHTYTATATSTTESISIGFSMAGPTGGYTYTANSTTVNLYWDRYTDNAFTIQSY